MLNRVDIIGNLGADPDVRSTASGQLVANMNVAVSERWKDQSGEQKEHTEWIRVVVWGKQAEFAQRYLTKGRKVFVTGKLRTRSWDDAQSGQKRYITEVQAERVQGLDRAAEASGQGGEQNASRPPSPRRPGPPDGPAQDPGFFDQDVPF